MQRQRHHFEINCVPFIAYIRLKCVCVIPRNWSRSFLLIIRILAYAFYCLCLCVLLSVWLWKEYFPNLLETWLSPRFFVFRVRDLKFCLLAYFLNSFICAKFQKDLQHWFNIFYKGPPLMFFDFVIYQKFKGGGDPYKMANINVV